MMPEIARRATLVPVVFALLSLASCGKSAGRPAEGKPVSGRVDTQTGVSFDFPSGWAEVDPAGRPYTKIYTNHDRQLEIRLVEAPAGGLAITTSGDQMKRGLLHDGTVEESGLATVDGRPAYRVVVKKKTPTGGSGIVVGVTILREGDRLSTVYVSSSGDEKVDHRPEIDALLGTVKVY